MRERLFEVVVGDVVDVDAVEDRLVEEAALFLVAASIQLAGVFQQFQAGFDQACAVGQVFVGGVQAFGEAAALAFDLSELGFDLGLGDGAVCGEVDEVVLTGVERS